MPEFRLLIRAATLRERDQIEARTASGEGIASDACIGVWVDRRLVGWGDDYGTYRVLPAPTSAGQLEEVGENLLAAAIALWEAEL